MKRTTFRSIPVAVGGSSYNVIARVFPARRSPHVGADSPSFMQPGQPARFEVIRILRGAEEVTSELLPFTRSAIEDAVREQVT